MSRMWQFTGCTAPQKQTVCLAQVLTVQHTCCTIRLMHYSHFNLLNDELNPISYLLALLAHHFLYVSRIRVNLLCPQVWGLSLLCCVAVTTLQLERGGFTEWWNLLEKSFTPKLVMSVRMFLSYWRVFPECLFPLYQQTKYFQFFPSDGAFSYRSNDFNLVFPSSDKFSMHVAASGTKFMSFLLFVRPTIIPTLVSPVVA